MEVQMGERVHRFLVLAIFLLKYLLLKLPPSLGDVIRIPGFRDWLLTLQREEHRPPQLMLETHPSRFDLFLTSGSLAGLSSCFDILLDEGQTVLVEELTFTSVLGMFQNKGIDSHSVQTDDQGLIPESLDDTMTNWKRYYPDRIRPHVLYVIPYGNNPSGVSWSEERMVQVYWLCRKHDLLLLDDGAYHFLTWGKKTQSLQSIDVDGRVVRFDTFSKTMGAGHRIGWISGPQAIIDKVRIEAESSYMFPSHLSQAYVLSQVTAWGKQRFQTEMNKLAEFYQTRAESIHRIALKYLKGLAVCRVPSGGMYLWIDVLGLRDATPLVDSLRDRGLRVVAGKHFKPDPSPCNGVRMSFSSVSEEQMERAMQMMADVIQMYQQNESGRFTM